MIPVESALYTRLTSGTALGALLAAGTAGIYHRLAPEGQDPPYVVFAKQSRIPERTIGGGGVAYEDAIYLVKGVAESPSALVAGSIAAAIDTLLDNHALTVTGYTTLTCHRDQDVDYVESGPGGQVIQHRGALYRIQVDPT